MIQNILYYLIKMMLNSYMFKVIIKNLKRIKMFKI